MLKNICYTLEGLGELNEVLLGNTMGVKRLPASQVAVLSAIERCLAGDTSQYYDEQDKVSQSNKIATAKLEVGSTGSIMLDKAICKRENVPTDIVCIRYTGLPSKFIRSFRCNTTQSCDTLDGFDGSDFAIDFTHYTHKVPINVWSRIEIMFNDIGVGKVTIGDDKVNFDFTGNTELAKVAYLLLSEAIFWHERKYKVVMLLNLNGCNEEFIARFTRVLQLLSDDIYITV